MLVSCVPNYYYYFSFECWTLYVKNHRNNLRPRMMLLSYKENLHVLLTRRDCWELQQSMILVCRRANLLLFTLRCWYCPDTCGVPVRVSSQSLKDLLRPPLGNLWTSVFVPIVRWGCQKSCSFFHLLSHFWSQQMPIAEKSTLKLVLTSPQVHLCSYFAAMLFYCLVS